MNPSCSNPGRSSGFSLIELMLAMLIGLIIMAGVMQVFVSTQDTQRRSEDHLALLGDARFAIETIAYDLRHTGLWGRNNNYQSIACQKSDTVNVAPCPPGFAMPVAGADCEPEDYINLERALFASNNMNPYAATCAAQAYKAGTDVLSLRYADTNKIATAVLATGVAYIRSSISGGMVFVGPTIPDVTGYKWKDNSANSNHLLISRTYYVSDYTDTVGDGYPSLRRTDLRAGPALRSEVLLPGVEDFQLEFGVDLGSNGVPGSPKDAQVDSYVDADNVTDIVGPPKELGWANGEVLAVRIWLLIRSKRADRNEISSAQTFVIAGNTVTTPDDGYVRYLVSSVVKLRNTYQDDLKEAGAK